MCDGVSKWKARVLFGPCICAASPSAFFARITRCNARYLHFSDCNTLVGSQESVLLFDVTVGFILVSIIAGPPVIKEFSSIFATAEERDESADSRFKLWKAATMITLDNPIFGVGGGATQYVIPKYERLTLICKRSTHTIFFSKSARDAVFLHYAVSSPL